MMSGHCCQALLPLDLRVKKTRALRRALTKEQVRTQPHCCYSTSSVLYQCAPSC